jgi:hypothetical protein
MTEMNEVLDEFEKDASVRTIVITGHGKAFAGTFWLLCSLRLLSQGWDMLSGKCQETDTSCCVAGADIKEMAPRNFIQVYSVSLHVDYTRAFSIQVSASYKHYADKADLPAG